MVALVNIRCFPAAAITAVTFAGWLHFAATAIAQESATPPAAPATSPLPLSSGTEDVLKLSRAKLGDDVTIAFIQNASHRYALTASEIIYLRKEGVSDRVLAAMISHQPGASAAADAAASVPPYVGPMARPVVEGTSPASTVYVTASKPAYYYDPWPYYYPYYYPYHYYYPYYSLGFSWGWGGCYYGYYGNHGHNGNHHPPPPQGGGQPLNTNPSTIARGGQAGGATRSLGSSANNRVIASPSSGLVGRQSSPGAYVPRGATVASASRVSSSSYGGTMNSGGFQGGGNYGAASAPRMSAGGGFQGGGSVSRMSAGGGFQGGGGSRGGGGGGSRR